MTLIERAQSIITKPQETWPKLAAEPQTVGSLYSGYIIPLALIAPVFGFVGLSLISHRSMMFGLLNGVLQYILALVAVFVTAFIAESLAPSFNGTKDRVQALKLIAYAQTPGWIGGVFLVIPVLGALLVLVAALYGLYLLYLGVTPVMNVPADKAAVYTIVLVVITIVIYFCITAIVGAVLAAALLSAGAMLY
jgi:hypothetical protein